MISYGRNEREIMRCRKHWMFYFWPLVATILTSGLAIVWLIYRILVACTDELVITNQKMYISRGIISKEAHSIPLQKLNDIFYTQGIIGRFLGYGTVFFGSGNVATMDGFSYLDNPVQIKATIENALESQINEGNERLVGYIGNEIKALNQGH